VSVCGFTPLWSVGSVVVLLLVLPACLDCVVIVCWFCCSVCWLWNTVTLKLLAERRRSSASFKFSVRFDTTTTNDYKSSCLLDALNRDKRLFEVTPEYIPAYRMLILSFQ